MIRTQEEFANACDFIDSDMELYDFTLSERMSSYEYNLYMQDAEYFLNFLYEKIRTLEELCEYLDHCVDTTISDSKKKIDADLAALQYTLDPIINQRIQNHILSWDMVQSKILLDRDGTVLTAAEQNTDILPASCVSSQVRPSLLKKEGRNNAYKDNIETALIDGYYLTTYQTGKQESIKDSVHVVLPTGSEYNCIEIDPINCSIEITNENDNVVITMLPTGYDKEYRAFMYDHYIRSALNQLIFDRHRYDTTKSLNDNHVIHNNAMTKAWQTKYLDDLWTYQKTRDKNQAKSNLTGET